MTTTITTTQADMLRAAVFTADAITHENAQEVFDRVRSA